MLNFEHQWRFNSPGKVPDGVISEFSKLIGKIAAQGSRWSVLETFKSYFANASGATSYPSTSESWAETDLITHMEQAAENATLFIEAFYDACEAFRNGGDYAVPDVAIVNRILTQHEAGFEIKPPDLVSQNAQVHVTVSSDATSVDEQGRSIIRKSLEESEKLLLLGKNRLAVQEILWLLETITTAFESVDVPAGTIGGKYFNKIANDLRRLHRGQILEQVMGWATTLHGYLSSPSGGGIRHGAKLENAVELETHQARLLCNLIRSYIAFLLAEHERLSRQYSVTK